MNELVRSHSFHLGVSFHGPKDDDSMLADKGWTEIPAGVGDDEDAFEQIALAMGAFGTIANRDFEEYSVASSDEGGEGESQSARGCSGSSFSQFAFGAGLGQTAGGADVWMQECPCAPLDEGDAYCDGNNGANGRYAGSSLRSFVARVVAPRESAGDSPSGAFDVADLPGFEGPGESPTLNEAGFLSVDSRLGNNVRMAILATELAEPYAAIRSVAEVELRDDDAVPLSPRIPGECRGTRSVEMPESSLLSEVEVTWTVGGSLTVDETAIMHGRWGVLDGKVFDCVTQPTKQELDTFFTVLRDFEAMEGETASQMEDDVSFAPVRTGVTRWRAHAGRGEVIPPETTFSVTLDLSDYSAGDVIAIYALARTDQGWAAGEDSSPRSNVVNSRTNPEWSFPNGIQGRLDFWSVPVTLTILPQPGEF